MENNKKQTAVEWFKDVIESFGNKHELQMSWTTLDELLEQAKEMEKEAHQETWDVAHQAGRFEGKGIAEENWFTFEEYWEETFKSE
jgi:hypothetical protein